MNTLGALLKILFLTFLIGCTLVSCTTKSDKTLTEETGSSKDEKVFAGIPTVDLQAEYPLKEIHLQDIADIEYIPLETNENSIITNIPHLFMNDETIVTYDYKTKNIVFFDRKGKYLHSFNRTGGSGEEYRSIYNICVDFDSNEVYVYDYKGDFQSAIQIYTFEGEYKRTLKVPHKMLFDIYNYDSEYLLVEDHLLVDRIEKRTVNQTPYYKMSKKNGELVNIPLTITNRIRNKIIFSKDVDKYTSQSISINYRIYPVANIGNEIMIADFALDTVYIYKNDKLLPIAVRNNQITKYDSHIIASIDVLTDKYMLWTAQDKRILDPETYASPDVRYLLFDRYTGECNEVRYFDANSETVDIRSMQLSNAYSLPRNYAMSYYPAYLLVELNEAGKLKGELKEIASKLKEDDNPVLMIATFK